MSPRRIEHCRRLIQFMKWHGRKIYLPDAYVFITAEKQLEQYQADAAFDDLFQLGAVDMTAVGDKWAIALLCDSLDQLLRRGA